MSLPIESLLTRLKTCSNDSEKFALLIIVSKVVSPESMTHELQSTVSRAISFSFIRRLLRAEREKENSGLYRTLGVTILKTCFLCGDHVEELGENMQLLLQVRHMLGFYRVLHSKPSGSILNSNK